MGTLRISGIQVNSRNGMGALNLDNATTFVREAAALGAQLVVGPELLAAGYILHHSLWNYAEPQAGPTETWLSEMAREQAIYVGAGYLEAFGSDFFNTFTLMRPDGTMAGRVRKYTHGFLESWFFRSGAQCRTIETEIGRIGVGICFDNYTGSFFEELHDARVDLILMPHSSPVPCRQGPVSRAIDSTLQHIAGHCARFLGRPTLLVNKAAGKPFQTPVPLLPKCTVPMKFPGRSTICNGDGETMDKLGGEEGIVVADVFPGRGNATGRPFSEGQFWSLPPPSLPNVLAACHRLVTRLGQKHYQGNRNRKQAALAVSKCLPSRQPGVAVDGSEANHLLP